MRLLAEYALRGRPKAIIVTAILVSLPLFSWVGGAVAALVVLAQGPREGLFVAMWASLPLLVGYAIAQDISSLLAFAAVVASASLLRAAGSWELVLYGAMILAVIQALLFGWLSSPILEWFVSSYLGILESMREAGASAPDEAGARGTALAFFALGQGVLTIVTLTLARWWQSEIYHPGGFGDEIQRVRLARPVAIGLGLATVGLAGMPEFSAWAAVVSLPLVVGGVCLTHALLKQRGVSRHWYVAFYASIVLFAQMAMAILALVMIADSFIDLRRQANV